ncbi:SGNH/GDSL hydrolase family protein [Belliella sp. DSM 111904]|uniref:SGNH/GDSL hydrolase family protein n=1 Tax=Belliella filtrata TaxID=2923435 RepID=A0ABS9V0I0_9BACT|nr:SGNH/GDSL hydrolase family protein [Belliella filtrata]MCH7409907.1 SGNH/GDSL hydrolase family protein [Belliella filtrata]
MKKLANSILLLTLIVAWQSCISSQSLQKNQTEMDSNKLTYLALGDSYTIGEGVEKPDRYPNQLVAKLKNTGIAFNEPTIIATTGWTTDELQRGVEDAQIKGKLYDLVTLLIGVNNQYRGRSVENFREEFQALLQEAIRFAGEDTSKVIVLSIPDWGITPFASDRNVDTEKVKREIDAFNSAKQAICSELGVTYIDITAHYRKYGNQPKSLVSDKLHPSAWIYDHWSDLLLGVIEK